MKMDQIKSFIKDAGKKVLAKPQHMTSKYNKDDLIHDNTIIRKLYKGFMFTKKLYPRYKLKYFLGDFIEDVKTICTDPVECNDLKENWIHFFISASDSEKLFMAQLFSLCGVFDDKICNMLIKSARDTKDRDFRYWITMDISETTFLLQNGFYDNYYIDRRELLKQIAIDGNYNIPKKRNTVNSEKKTIAIITYILSEDIYNSIQRVAMMLAKGLHKYFNIYIFTLDSFYIPLKEENKINTISYFRTFSSIKNRNSIDGLFGETASVKYVSTKSYINRNQEFLDNLYTVNPDCILDISDECSPLSFFYFRDYPTVYMAMRSGASSSFFSYITGKQERKEELNQQFHFMKDEVIIDWGGFPEYVPPDTKGYSRSQLGIKKDQFVIVTIGKCADCCSNEFSEEIVELLENNKKMVWLIVGDKAPTYIHKKYPHLIQNKKIIERKFERNLKALCKECDCLLRPDVTGGSGATAIAAMSGLPIAMTSFLCDPMRWLGRDYSSIDNYHDLALYIEHLSSDQNFYIKEQFRTRDLVEKAINAEEKWERLANELNKIIEDGKL